MTDNQRRSRRPVSGGRRTNKRTTTYTDTELADIKDAAERQRMAVDAWIGMTVVAAARSGQAPAPEALRELLHAVTSVSAEAKRQGVNLNQVAAQLNTTGQLRPSVERHLQDALDQVSKALSEINAAMRQITGRL